MMAKGLPSRTSSSASPPPCILLMLVNALLIILVVIFEMLVSGSAQWYWPAFISLLWKSLSDQNVNPIRNSRPSSGIDGPLTKQMMFLVRILFVPIRRSLEDVKSRRSLALVTLRFEIMNLLLKVTFGCLYISLVRPRCIYCPNNINSSCTSIWSW